MEMAMKVKESNMEPCELTIDELDNVSGGFAWIALITVGLIFTGIIAKMFHLD